MRAREFITENNPRPDIEIRWDDNFTVDAYIDGVLAGSAEFYSDDPDGNYGFYAGSVDVKPEFRRMGVATAMYDAAREKFGDIIPSKYQTDDARAFWKKSRGEERVWESVEKTTTLEQLYQGNYPDRNESFWDEVRSSDLKTPLTVHTMPKHKVKIMVLSQYHVEHLDELVDIMDEDQQEVLQHYMNDPALSNKVIVVSGHRIIDGNHRALAASYKNVPINYVDLTELDEQDLDEELASQDTNKQKTKDWIQKVYELYPHTWQNNHVMLWGEGDDQQLAMFELTPSSTKGAVEVKWFQAYPLRAGVGTRAMRELQKLAIDDGISLILYPWDKGKVSKSALTKFYKKQGFKPLTKSGNGLIWHGSK